MKLVRVEKVKTNLDDIEQQTLRVNDNDMHRMSIKASQINISKVIKSYKI